MIYIITPFLAIIIFTIGFILWAFKSLIDLKWRPKESPFYKMPPIIERAYKAIDFKAQTNYIMEKDFSRGMMRNFSYPKEDIQNIICDDRHRNHIIRENVISLADEMIKAGCIEIKDIEDWNNPYGPDARILSMKVKVYKPE